MAMAGAMMPLLLLVEHCSSKKKETCAMASCCCCASGLVGKDSRGERVFELWSPNSKQASRQQPPAIDQPSIDSQAIGGSLRYAE